MRARGGAARSYAGLRPGVAHTHHAIATKGGALKLVLVADTHSSPHPDAAKRIAAEEPDAILHGGDIGDLRVLEELGRIAPVTAVRGNIDAHTPGLCDSVTIDLTEGDDVRVRLLLMHIAVAGPRIRADAARLARAENASIIACGHSHVPFIGRDRGLVVINPGSIGPRRFQLPIVFGVMELGPKGVELHHVSVETGERWLP